jgi:hypothetical protein
MAFSINEIQNTINSGGGLGRQNLFQVHFTNKENSVADFRVPFQCEASELPSRSKGNIAVPYFGRVHNRAGEVVYQPWTVTIQNTEDFLIRNALEDWDNAINSPEGNVRTLQNYHSQGTVHQLSQDASKGIIKTYKFHNIYPANISAIRLDWADNNQYEKFDVTFMYDYFTTDDSFSNSLLGGLI